MNYSEEDIHHLLDDLVTIGHYETPAEEAQRHSTGFLKHLQENPVSPDGNFIDYRRKLFYSLVYFLVDRNIPHTFASRLSITEWGNMGFQVFVLVRGKSIGALSSLDMDTLAGEVVRHQDLPQLLAHTAELKAKYSGFTGLGLETLDIV
jgi:hypothetical protein